jgi:hypothetical protein
MRAFARQAMRSPAALGVLAFWGGLWIAMRRYPSEFDWRYMTISSRVYPERDPDGYAWAWAGILICALGGTALLPIVLGRIVQAYLSFARPELPWVGLEWRARGLPVYLSFAFWEWSACAVLSAYTALLCAVGVDGPQATRYGFT